MIVVPLIFTSLVIGVSNLGKGANLGKIGGKTLLYYMTTSLIALVSGLLLVNLIKPGVGVSLNLPDNTGELLKETSVRDTLLGIVPENIFNALSSNNATLSVIFFAVLFGFFMTRVGDKQKETLTNFFDSAFEVIMKITLAIISLAPLGVFGLVTKTVAEQENLGQLFQSLGKFMITAVAGLSIHFFIALPILLLIFGKINPLKHAKSVITPLLTAFSTASSNATLPLTMEALENKSGVSNKITSFTIPLGATINMDGTALYELIVVGFVAQLYGVELSFAQQFLVVGTALLASIGTAGVPMASYVAMTIIFTAVNLPLEAMLIVLPVDRVLDMYRTATNVWSDTCGAVIIAKSEGEKLNV
ncbi:dicarboxylate/amino acid:cation symporter [Bacteroidales bacterium]|nr:dicarboxylate/amino acid:cation symporter [Bacteroidales bacterium]